MTDIIKNLMELNIVLPEPSKPVANYSPFVIENKRIYVSGQIPIKKGVLLYKGKAGKDISIEEAKEAAALCLINTISVLRNALQGNLNNLKACIKINVFINSVEEFYEQPEVADGASDLIKKIFKVNGNHARSAVSCNSLPKNAAVEIDSIFLLKN